MHTYNSNNLRNLTCIIFRRAPAQPCSSSTFLIFSEQLWGMFLKFHPI
jgi:hypothetical protein